MHAHVGNLARILATGMGALGHARPPIAKSRGGRGSVLNTFDFKRPIAPTDT